MRIRVKLRTTLCFTTGSHRRVTRTERTHAHAYNRKYISQWTRTGWWWLTSTGKVEKRDGGGV